MLKVEVGKGPLMFMSYARIQKDITGTEEVEEFKNSYYAILYDFGMPIGCGRMKIENNLYTIDNIKIFDDYHSEELVEEITSQLIKKGRSLGIEEK
jgi:hypothetical protein